MLTDKQIIDFFEIFWKKITNKEIQIIRWEKKWNLVLNKESKDFLEKVKKYSWIFKISPCIKEVFVCNTAAFWSANKKSDIDLFIVTTNWKIWTWRIFTSFLIHIFWLRRWWKNIEWKFCLSFWATEKWAKKLGEIQIKENKDPYLAIWTRTLIPILDKWFFEEFKKENSWIENYWLNYNPINNGNQSDLSNKKSSKENPLNPLIQGWTYHNSNVILNKIEKLIKKIFEKRALRKRKKLKNPSGVIISNEFLKFHDNDIRIEVAKEIRNL